MTILVLYGEDGAGAARLRHEVAYAAAALGLAPVFVQATDVAAVDALAAAVGYRILPLDDAAVAIAARLSPRMERPLVVGDVDALQDKWGQRRAFARHGVPSPPFALVESAADVLDCGAQWGYPLMLKPARGTRSHGVRRVDGPDNVPAALTAACRAARANGLDRVLAEGYLDGPDVAVESMVIDGVTAHVSFWQSGWVGDSWLAAAPLGAELRPHLGAIGDVVARANAALGLCWAATSNEVRVTAEGPMLVEANARLGGGPCEDGVRLHTGVDRIAALLALLSGSTPPVTPRRARPVMQLSLRAAARGVVQRVDVLPRLLGDAHVRLGLDVAPGVRIDDPSAYLFGWLLVEGEPLEAADHLLARAAEYVDAVRVSVAPLG